EVTTRRGLRTMCDGTKPGNIHRRGQWRLGPLKKLKIDPGRLDVRRALRSIGEGSEVVGLVDGDTLVALAAVVPQPHPLVSSMIESARAAGCEVIVATADDQLVERVGA